MIERIDPASVTVTLYHACSYGASGSALGPHELVSYWWADPHKIRLILADGATPDDAQEIHDAVRESITIAPGAAIRAAQDAAGESLS